MRKRSKSQDEQEYTFCRCRCIFDGLFSDEQACHVTIMPLYAKWAPSGDIGNGLKGRLGLPPHRNLQRELYETLLCSLLSYLGIFKVLKRIQRKGKISIQPW